jgi:hypothetical protein
MAGGNEIPRLLNMEKGETLRGVELVVVSVERISREAADDGVNQVGLQIEVARRLRDVGLGVLDVQRLDEYVEQSDHPNVPAILSVGLSLEKVEGNSYLFLLRVALTEHVALVRAPDMTTMAHTYEETSFGVFPVDGVGDGCRRQVGIHVDHFIDAWLRANA